MSEATATNPVTGLPDAPKRRQRRAKGTGVAATTPAFFVIQVCDEGGNPVSFDKTRIRVVTIERSAEKVLDLVESNENPHAFYMRVQVPAARRGAPSAANS